MAFGLIQEVFGWCALLNMGVLLWWFLFIALAHDWTYRMHCRFYRINIEDFDRIHYAGMTFYKLTIIFFNAVPWLVMKVII